MSVSCTLDVMTFTDICNKTYFLTSTNSATFPIAQLTIEINNAYDRVISLIFQSDSRWQWDDSNNTDLPIATTNLVSSQQDYTLSVTHLEITRVEVQDTGSNWLKLIPFDQQDIYGQSLTDYYKDAGQPRYYDKLGASIFLYPKPNYSQSNALKVWFQRGPAYFTTADTTKTPGFNSLYHDLLPYYAAYNFAVANGKSSASGLLQIIQTKEEALQEDYALRSRDDHNRFKGRPMQWN